MWPLEAAAWLRCPCSTPVPCLQQLGLPPRTQIPDATRLECSLSAALEQAARPGSASLDRFEAANKEIQQVEQEKVRGGAASCIFQSQTEG